MKTLSATSGAAPRAGRIRTRILSAYATAPVVVREKAFVVFVIDAVMAALAGVFAVSGALLGERPWNIGISAVTALSMAGSAFLLVKGRYHFSSAFTIGAAFVGLVAMMTAGFYPDHLRLYALGMTMQAVLLVATLLGERPILIPALGAASAIAEIAFWFELRRQTGKDDAEILSVLIVVLLIQALGTTVAWLLMRLSKRVMGKLEAEGLAAAERAERLAGLADSGRTSAESGEALARSARTTEEAVRRIEGILASAGKRATELGADAERGATINARMDADAAVIRKALDSQAAVVEETGAAVEQMNASIRSIDRIAEDRSAQAAALSEGVGKARAELSKVRQVLGTLGDAASGISGIVGLIGDISERTNLLSMNAAIQAARAGEAGKGFAVVAGEIRQLAASTAENAKRIELNISQVVAGVGAADQASSGIAGVFGEISRESDAVAEGMGEIRRAIAEVASGTGEIDHAVQSLREASRSSERALDSSQAASAEGSAFIGRVAGGIGDVADKVKEAASSFGAIVGEAARVREIGEATRERIAELASRAESIS